MGFEVLFRRGDVVVVGATVHQPSELASDQGETHAKLSVEGGRNLFICRYSHCCETRTFPQKPPEESRMRVWQRNSGPSLMWMPKSPLEVS